MKSANRVRTYLGKLPTLGDREYVYLCDDALEIDLIDGYSVETKRSFFSDIIMITWHQRYSRWGLWLSGSLLVFVGIITLLVIKSSGSGIVGLIVSCVMMAPVIVIFLCFLRRYAIIKIYGKRTNASLSWHYRHEKSRRIFADLTRRIRQYQERDHLAAQDQMAERSVSGPRPPDDLPAIDPVSINQPPVASLGDGTADIPSSP
jgi:hypothetical protein